MGLLNQQNTHKKCQIKQNAKEFLKGEEAEEAEEEQEEKEFHTKFYTNEHYQHILTNKGKQSKSTRRRRRKNDIKTAFCFLCLFLSTITPTTTTTRAKTYAVTATILTLTSVLLHVPLIAASSLQEEVAENNKNFAAYFARPWTDSLVNGELGVEVEVEPALGVIVNDLERQGTSNEQQLLAFYERAKQKQKQQEKKMLKYIENYEFDEPVKKRAATKRSVATVATIISKPINATKSSKNTLSTTVTSLPIFSTTKRTLESLSSVIVDGELGVQESTLLEDKCEPKVLNSVPMEPVSL